MSRVKVTLDMSDKEASRLADYLEQARLYAGQAAEVAAEMGMRETHIGSMRDYRLLDNTHTKIVAALQEVRK